MSFLQKLFGKREPKQKVTDDARQQAHDDRKAFTEVNFIIGQKLLNEKQYERAFETFKLIAENDDHLDSQFNLAIMYHRGMGTEKDIHEAIRWYESVSRHGDNQASYNLGLIFYYGDDGLLPDHEKAVQWMRLAVKQGNEKAKSFLYQIITTAFEQAAAECNISLMWNEQDQAYRFTIPCESVAERKGNGIIGIFKVMEQTFLQMYLPFPEITNDKKADFEQLLSEFSKQLHVQLRMDQYNKIYTLILLDTDKLLQSSSIESDMSQILQVAISETRLICNVGLA